MDSTQELDKLGKDVAARGVRCGIAATGRCLPAVSLGYSAFAPSLDIREGPIDLLAGLGPVPRAEPRGDRAGGFLGVFVV